MIETGLVLCRFGLDSALLYLWGSSIYLWALVPRPLALHLWSRLRALQRLAVMGGLICLLASLPLQALSIGGDTSEALRPGRLIAVLSTTTPGAAWLCQTASFLLLLAAQVLPCRVRMLATAGTSALVLASSTITGHAAMHDGLQGVLHRANSILHLLAGGAWIGALVPVLLILGLLNDSSRQAPAKTALMRFSRAGHAVVAVVILSGVLNIRLVVGALSLNWDQPYQRLLIMKIGLVALLALIAISNRYVWLPRLRQASGFRGLLWGSLAEIALALAVMALVARFGLLTPSVEHPAHYPAPGTPIRKAVVERCPSSLERLALITASGVPIQRTPGLPSPAGSTRRPAPNGQDQA